MLINLGGDKSQLVRYEILKAACPVRVPLKRQMIKELIELLFEQMKVIAPINPLSKGFILGVEGLFDRFPSLEIYHKLENSSASATPTETQRSYFIKIFNYYFNLNLI